jgi:hypothetical protein
MPNARRNLTESAKRSRNVLKYGRYAMEAIARRREISGLLREIKFLAARHYW